MYYNFQSNYENTHKNTHRGIAKNSGVYLWSIHVDIWQNQYNIVKLKNKKKKWGERNEDADKHNQG